MNKADITIMHVKACKNLAEAWSKIANPIKGFGYKLTKNEQSFAYHFAKLYFGKEA